MAKLKWGMWKMLRGKMVDGTPVRIMFQLPYDWKLTHTNEHVKKYWAKRRKKKLLDQARKGK